jgi:hypothetical protein
MLRSFRGIEFALFRLPFKPRAFFGSWGFPLGKIRRIRVKGLRIVLIRLIPQGFRQKSALGIIVIYSPDRYRPISVPVFRRTDPVRIPPGKGFHNRFSPVPIPSILRIRPGANSYTQGQGHSFFKHSKSIPHFREKDSLRQAQLPLRFLSFIG